MPLRDRLQARSTALLLSIEGSLGRIVSLWLALAALASAARIFFSPLPAGLLETSAVVPYILLVIAPAASLLLALRWFANGDDLPQPSSRLAVVGRWRSVSREEARAHPLYGTSGIMVSLLVGVLLNVPVRAAEFLVAVPSISGAVPRWLGTLHTLMTFDAVLLSSLYAIAFVAALRRVPLFPRLLVAIWAVDLMMQLGIARAVTASGDLPRPVAESLHLLLEGNVKKVLISIALWLPYLLLSKRVNVTFRNRLSR